MNPIEGVNRDGKLLGWVQKRAGGGWRALTLSGHLTHHQSRQSAREAVRCSM
jgi:hypothetical protein